MIHIPQPDVSGGFTVIKAGGSLLDLPDIGDRILRLISRTERIRPLLLFGGGSAADLVRGWDEQLCLGPKAAHELAIAAMSLTARLAEQLSPRFRRISDLADAGRILTAGRIPVVDLCAAVRRLPPKSRERTEFEQLPASWDTTSDTLSLWLAHAVQAEQLWLLKSVAGDDSGPVFPVTAESAAALSRRGHLDAAFAGLLRPCDAVTWVNLRSREFDQSRS